MNVDITQHNYRQSIGAFDEKVTNTIVLSITEPEIEKLNDFDLHIYRSCDERRDFV